MYSRLVPYSAAIIRWNRVSARMASISSEVNFCGARPLRLISRELSAGVPKNRCSTFTHAGVSH